MIIELKHKMDVQIENNPRKDYTVQIYSLFRQLSVRGHPLTPDCGGDSRRWEEERGPGEEGRDGRNI